jgi:hypothetical protein
MGLSELSKFPSFFSCVMPQTKKKMSPPLSYYKRHNFYVGKHCELLERKVKN